MSDVATVPRDDRAWPRGALAVSLAAGFGALAGSAALVAAAYSLGRATELTFVFFATACLSGLSYSDAMRPWLRGEPLRPRTRKVQPVLGLLVLAAYAGSATTGTAALCGYLVGLALPNAATIWFARVHRITVEEGWGRAAAQARSAADPVPGPTAERRTRRVPKVGPVLRETLAEQRDRCLAWAAATALVATGCVGLGAAPGRALALALPGLAALAWVGWHLLRVRLAQRDFERASTEPRAAFVVLVSDPRPTAYRPVLGIWTEEPRHTEGRLPPAAAVYRCDARQSALLCTPGFLTVHEAWVDTGPSSRSRPRWVAADAGIALPVRRSVLGPRYLGSIIGAEQMPRARPLTIRAPNPTTENATGAAVTVVTERPRGTERWVRLLGWRVAALAGTAACLTWVWPGG